jgi:precorrin-2/cobalt-factor-2 C20-methyltransferase
MKTGKLTGVGLGPGAPDLLTLRAVRALREADVIYTVEGPKSKLSVSAILVDSLGEISAARRSLSFSMSHDPEERTRVVKRNSDIIFSEIEKGLNCVFAVIGDPAIYSTFGYVLHRFRAEHPETRVEMIPGITSFSALASAGCFILSEDEEPLHVIPSHVGPGDADETQRLSGCTVFLKAYRNRNLLLDQLRANGTESVWYGARIGLEGELFAQGFEEISDLPEEYLSLLVSKRNSVDA